MSAVSITRARNAKARLKALVKDDASVAGVGLTKVGGDYALKLNLKTARGASGVPDSIDRVPIVKEVVGTIRKR